MGRAANAYCLAPKCILGLAMIILLVAGTPAEGLLTQELTGPGSAAEWRVSNSNGSVRTGASVPGHVHLGHRAAV